MQVRTCTIDSSLVDQLQAGWQNNWCRYGQWTCLRLHSIPSVCHNWLTKQGDIFWLLQQRLLVQDFNAVITWSRQHVQRNTTTFEDIGKGLLQASCTQQFSSLWILAWTVNCLRRGTTALFTWWSGSWTRSLKFSFQVGFALLSFVEVLSCVVCRTKHL